MRMRWLVLAATVGLLAAGCGAEAPASFTLPSFPAGNPTAGAKLFATTCIACHAPTATGVPGLAPTLRGQAFLFTLYPTQAQLAEFIQQYMPKVDPGSLSAQQAANLAAFIYGINGKLGASTKQQLLGLLPKPSAPSTSKAPTTTSQYLSYSASAKTVTLTLIGGMNGTAGGFNFNGEAKGAMVVTVPTGWKVTVHYSNKGVLPHSAAIVTNATATSPAFPGAGLSGASLTSGIPSGSSATFSFTTGAAGTYRIACLVPGHEALGMWDVFKVTTSGTPSIKL